MSNTSDPIERAERALRKAREERDTLQAETQRARLDRHQLQRCLTATQEELRDAQNRMAVMQARIDAAEQRAEQAKRAMLDHAGRLQQ